MMSNLVGWQRWLILFLAEGIFGYVLQSAGYVLGIFAFEKRKVEWKPFCLITGFASIASFIIRNYFQNLNFGVHTLIMLFALNILAAIFLKSDLRNSVSATLIVTVLVLLCEIATMGVLAIFLGGLENAKQLTQDEMLKAAVGIPMNILLIGIVSIIYAVRMHLAAKKKDA